MVIGESVLKSHLIYTKEGYFSRSDQVAIVNIVYN